MKHIIRSRQSAATVNKRALYENIMTRVSKVVKRHLNEAEEEGEDIITPDDEYEGDEGVETSIDDVTASLDFEEIVAVLVDTITASDEKEGIDWEEDCENEEIAQLVLDGDNEVADLANALEALFNGFYLSALDEEEPEMTDDDEDDDDF